MEDIWYSLYAMFMVILGKLFMICVLGSANEIAVINYIRKLVNRRRYTIIILFGRFRPIVCWT